MTRPIAGRVLGALGAVVLLSSVITLFFGNTRFLLAKLALGLVAVVAGFALGEAGGLRRFLGGRALHYGAATAVSGLAVVAVLATAGWVAWRRPVTWDLTRDRLFTLQEDSLRTLRGLSADVTAVAVYRADEPGVAEARALLERYAAVSPRFRHELVDPWRDPGRAKALGVVAGGPRILLLSGDRKAPASAPDEQGVTNALVRVTREGSRRVYFTQGHGEPDPRGEGPRSLGALASALLGEGYQVSALALGPDGEVPADATVVVSAGARAPLFGPESEALARYAARGGHLGIFLEPDVDAGLDALLRAHGLEADDDVVVDPSPAAQLFGSPVSPIALPSTTHPITREFADTGLVLPTARSLVGLRDVAVKAVPLALSGQEAWGELDLRGVFDWGDARRDEGEKGGPLPLAMAVEGPGGKSDSGAAGTATAEGGAARLVVAGDSDFLTDQYLQLGANRDFALNTIAWLAEQEDRITLRPRRREGSLVMLTEAQARTLELLAVDVLPVGLLAIGLGVWMVRRSR